MDLVQSYLQHHNYKFLRLDGATAGDDRTEAMHQFNAKDSEYYIFMATTRAGGQGINLQTAATVIHFESDWNPHADQQAQDRYLRVAPGNARGRERASEGRKHRGRSQGGSL